MKKFLRVVKEVLKVLFALHDAGLISEKPTIPTGKVK